MAITKICGLTNDEDIRLCVAAGADLIGLVVDYPLPVPWNLTVAQAKELMAAIPPHVGICLVTGGAEAKILQLAEELQPHFIQLHYRETLAETAAISRTLKSRGIKTIKALRIDDQGRCDFRVADPLLAAQALAQTDIWALLVDAYTAARPGGTGQRVDLTLFEQIQARVPLPVILAGGLNPANIAAVVQASQPFAVDVLTGVEKSPGLKDQAKVENFIASVHSR